MLMTSKLHMLTFLTCHWFPVTWISIGRFSKAFVVVFEFPNEVKGLKTSQLEAFPFAKKENKANGLSETENKANRLRYTKAIHKDSAILVSKSNLSLAAGFQARC